MIRCIAVDDEPLALELIESYIARTPFLELVGSYTNALEAITTLRSGEVDLLFLDIQMPSVTGLEIASQVDTYRTKVVFITAFDSYALEGFRVNAIDYLMKPVSFLQFSELANKAKRLIAGDAKEDERTLVVKSDYRLIQIGHHEILYIESMRDYVGIVLEDGTMIKTLSTLKGIEQLLDDATFCRVHRSFIVNMTKVKVMERNQILFGKTAISVSEAYREEVYERLRFSGVIK